MREAVRLSSIYAIEVEDEFSRMRDECCRSFGRSSGSISAFARMMQNVFLKKVIKQLREN